jgi:hypothetical protein
MKILSIILCFFVIIALQAASPPKKNFNCSPKSNGCTQEYKFFFKNQHNDIFWIGENRYGECGESHLIQILIDEKTQDEKSQNSRAVITESKIFNDWEWLEKAKQTIKSEEFITQKAENGVITFPAMELYISPPPNDIQLQASKNEDFPNDCAKIWNKNKGKSGICLPIMKGLKTDLVYYYQDGLYFNYTIEKVYIFPLSRYLVLFTKNQNLCNGENTMHGFMIFRFEMAK